MSSIPERSSWSRWNVSGCRRWRREWLGFSRSDWLTGSRRNLSISVMAKGTQMWKHIPLLGDIGNQTKKKLRRANFRDLPSAKLTGRQPRGYTWTSHRLCELEHLETFSWQPNLSTNDHDSDQDTDKGERTNQHRPNLNCRHDLSCWTTCRSCIKLAREGSIRCSNCVPRVWAKQS